MFFGRSLHALQLADHLYADNCVVLQITSKPFKTLAAPKMMGAECATAVCQNGQIKVAGEQLVAKETLCLLTEGQVTHAETKVPEDRENGGGLILGSTKSAHV